MDLSSIQILDVQPSQFYISQNKIEQIKMWFDFSNLFNFEPLPIKELNGKIIFTDGHTRAYVAYLAGLQCVPLCWDEDNLDWEAYQICVDACTERGVLSVADFSERILSAEDYAQLWNGWCDKMHNKLELHRK